MTLETLHDQTLNCQSCSANEFATEALPGRLARWAQLAAAFALRPVR